MEDFKDIVSKLRALQSRKPTPKRHAELYQAINSKHEGIQAVGLQVLGAWGDRESVEALHAFVESTFARRHGLSIRRVAIMALKPHLGSKDVEWIMNLCFSLTDAETKHDALQLVVELPPDRVKGRLKKELKSPDWTNREAAVRAIGSMDFPERNQLLTLMLKDNSKQVKAIARLLLERR